MRQRANEISKKIAQKCIALVEARARELGDKKKVAKELGVQPSSVNRWIDKQIGLSLESALNILLRYGNIDVEKIFLGEGKASFQPQLKIYPPTDSFKAYFHETFSKENYIPIRLLNGSVAAGPANEVREEDIQSWVLIYADKRWMPHDPEHYTCVYVYGHSMYPILSDGDIVAIDHLEKDPAKLDGKIVAFRVDGGVTIKWLKYDAKKRVVVGIPENHDYLDHLVTLRGDEIDKGIVGKVAWWWAKR